MKNIFGITKILRQNKDLVQENRMLKRIICNLKRKIREKIQTGRRRRNSRWSKEQKNLVKILREEEGKDFSDIGKIMGLSSKGSRRVYAAAKEQTK